MVSKRHVVSLIIFKSASVRLDEFDGVGNQLKVASLRFFVCFSFLLIKSSDDANSGILVEILFRNFSELVEVGDLDPVGLFL